MIHTLVFGAAVHSMDTHRGTIKRILINDGIANQFTVDPGLLSVERILPISVVAEATNQGVQLNINSDDEWKAFPAYRMEGILGTSNHEDPSVQVLETAEVVGAGYEAATGSQTTTDALPSGAIVLSSATHITGAHADATLHGLVIDTGRPHQLLLNDGRTIPIEAAAQFSSDMIVLHPNNLAASDPNAQL